MSDMPEPIVQNYHLIKAVQKERDELEKLVATLDDQHDLDFDEIGKLKAEIAALRAPLLSHQWISVETLPENDKRYVEAWLVQGHNAKIEIMTASYFVNCLKNYGNQAYTHWRYHGPPTPPDDCE